MRILHTSDWHLGRSFHREGMLEHQAAYVDHLLEVVEPSASTSWWSPATSTTGRSRPSTRSAWPTRRSPGWPRSRARVVVTSGNHDSAQRLGFGSRLIDAAGVYIRTDAATVGTPVAARRRRTARSRSTACPTSTRTRWPSPGRCPAAPTRPRSTEAMRRVRADLAARTRGTRSVVLAHAFVAGGEPSESERDISVGGVSLVPTGVFDGVDYVALGHLHGRARP